MLTLGSSKLSSDTRTLLCSQYFPRKLNQMNSYTDQDNVTSEKSEY